MASWAVVKAYNGAVLDELKRQGVAHKGGLGASSTWGLEMLARMKSRAILTVGGRVAQQFEKLRSHIESTKPSIATTFRKNRVLMGVLTLNRIVPKEERNRQLQQKELISYANARGLTIALTPDPSFGGSNRASESDIARSGLSRIETTPEISSIIREANYDTERALSDAARNTPQQRHSVTGQFRARQKHERHIPQKRHGKTGKFIPYKKGPSGYLHPCKAKRGKKEAEALGEEADILTAGDDRVCQACQDAADAGPYPIDEAQGLIPLHWGCRCALIAASSAIGDAGPDDEPRDKFGRWTFGTAQDHATNYGLPAALPSGGKKYLRIGAWDPHAETSQNWLSGDPEKEPKVGNEGQRVAAYGVRASRPRQVLRMMAASSKRRNWNRRYPRDHADKMKTFAEEVRAQADKARKHYVVADYDPNQPRDRDGKWTGGGGDAGVDGPRGNAYGY